MSDASPTDPRVTAARAFCTLASEWRHKQLKREEDALAFQVPELQWSADAAALFKGGMIDGYFSPPRPMLSISKIDQPIQLILNQERAAHLGVEIHPLSEKANKDTAEVLQDIYRGIERDSFADLARSWGFERAVKAGLGCYRILTEYADDGGSIHDQKIVIKRILDQRCVLFDPFATEPDWSDGQKALVYEMVPFDRYKREYGKSSVADFDAADFEGMEGELDEGWFTGTEGSGRMIRVAEYFYVEHADETQQEGGKSRQMRTPIVHWCKVNGTEVLDESIIPGRYIPLIPVVGQELQPFDGERRWFGVINRAMDAQRLLNIEVSNAVGKDALATKSPWLVAEGQEEGHEAEFELSTVRNLAMIRYKPTDLKGQLVEKPSRMLESPDLSSSLQLIQQANDYIQATTYTYDPSLGKQSRSGKPARAILAEQQQSEQGNSNYLDNLARAMRHEARVVLGMIAAVYDRPGRIVRGVDGEDNEREILINAPFVTGPDGRPQPAGQPGLMQKMAGKMGMGSQPKPKTYDLREGMYGVSVTIGKSHRSRLEAGADALGTLIQSSPEALMPLLGPTWLSFQDWPGAREAADLLKRKFPQPAKDDEEESPEVLQGKLQQQGQMIEAAKQQIDQMTQALETKQVEQQGKIAAVQASDAGKAQLEQLKAEMALREQAMQGQIDAMLAKVEGAIKLRLQDDQQAHQMALAVAQAGQSEREREASDEHADATAERGHEQALESDEQSDARTRAQGDGAGE